MTSSRSPGGRSRPQPRGRARPRGAEPPGHAARPRGAEPPGRTPPAGERLQKVLAAAGVASRRASEELIVDGRVSVDGRVVTVLGTRVDPARARIEVDGERVAVSQEYDYVILNKPEGVLTTARDPQGRSTVLDLV
ncbi:MAG: rRNA pseudouridine synthase, partial [Acidobacteria bacterium]|nr:rRNA pseudouridine synthase [Acidobacteriota bacterium]